MATAVIIGAGQTAAAAIRALGPERRAQIGAAARARVSERYSIESVADQLADLYRELAPQGVPSAA